MAKKKFPKTNKLLFVIVAMIILIGAIVFVKQKWTIQITPSPLPTIFADTSVKIPNDWKTNVGGSSFSFSYKYPSNWYFKEEHQSGIPNFGVFHDNDGKECIAFSTGNSGGTLDEGIRSLIINGILPKDDVISSQEFTTINGYKALIEEINSEGDRFIPGAQNHFYSGAIDLGPDEKNPGTSLRKGMILSTCSLAEKDTLLKILNSIQLK